MSNATILLVNNKNLGDFYFTQDQVEMARRLIAAGFYSTSSSFFFNQEGEDAAEEAFDLTNNPMRQDERVQLYGRGRSLSVGDIVNVDGVNFLCASNGWKIV